MLEPRRQLRARVAQRPARRDAGERLDVREGRDGAERVLREVVEAGDDEGGRGDAEDRGLLSGGSGASSLAAAGASVASAASAVGVGGAGAVSAASSRRAFGESKAPICWRVSSSTTSRAVAAPSRPRINVSMSASRSLMVYLVVDTSWPCVRAACVPRRDRRDVTAEM